jgi:NAD(P)-dependent dehydrogenase (short-subunit alcohol dehydrogenase family)
MPNHGASHTDPREFYPKPPFDEPKQRPPGHETAMRTKPDHGEDTYKGSGRLRDKIAVITGSDSGIGRAVAIAFAREGADVVISCLSEEEQEARETARWVKDAGRKSLELPGDIREEAWCQEVITRTTQEFGRCDILVNNAAFQATHPALEEFSSEEWDKTFRTNIYPMFYLAKAAAPHMKPGGAIINTASVQAFQPSGKLLAYASTKGAIVTFTRALSELLIEKGIRVNAVAPGPVWTPLIPSTMEDKAVSNFGKDSPLARPAQPAELAPAYVYLASSDSSYLTASVMDLTGGKMLP